VRGAAFAVDPSSDIYGWLMAQEGVTSANVVPEMRKALAETLRVLDEVRSAPLSDVLTKDRVDWAYFKAIMFGAGIVAFNTYNQKFREARFTSVNTRGVREPTPQVDSQHAMSVFDKLVTQAREG
jgi:hypothetical protein